MEEMTPSPKLSIWWHWMTQSVTLMKLNLDISTDYIEHKKAEEISPVYSFYFGDIKWPRL